MFSVEVLSHLQRRVCNRHYNKKHDKFYFSRDTHSSCFMETKYNMKGHCNLDHGNRPFPRALRMR